MSITGLIESVPKDIDAAIVAHDTNTMLIRIGVVLMIIAVLMVKIVIARRAAAAAAEKELQREVARLTSEKKSIEERELRRQERPSGRE